MGSNGWSTCTAIADCITIPNFGCNSGTCSCNSPYVWDSSVSSCVCVAPYYYDSSSSSCGRTFFFAKKIIIILKKLNSFLVGLDTANCSTASCYTALTCSSNKCSCTLPYSWTIATKTCDCVSPYTLDSGSCGMTLLEKII